MAPLVTSAGVALIWPVLAHNELVISGAALIVACVLAILPRRWRHAGTALPLSWRSCSSPCDRHPLVQLSPGQKPGLFLACRLVNVRDIESGKVRATRELFGVDQDHIPRANGCRRLSEQRQLGESRLCVSN
jgi:hypothetical protein